MLNRSRPLGTALLSAMLAWAFNEPVAACAQQDRAAAVFLAAFHHDPALLDPVRARPKLYREVP